MCTIPLNHDKHGLSKETGNGIVQGAFSGYQSIRDGSQILLVSEMQSPICEGYHWGPVALKGQYDTVGQKSI
jgi:hypothetical protein